MAGVREKVAQHSHCMASCNARMWLTMAYPDDLLWPLETRATTPRGAKAFTLLQPSLSSFSQQPHQGRHGTALGSDLKQDCRLRAPGPPHQSRAGGRAHRKCHIYPFAESSQGQEADTELTPTSQGKDKPAPRGQAQRLVFLLVSPPYLNSLGATSLSEKEGSCFKQNLTVMSIH